MEEAPWYERWPMRLQKEQYEIERRFPSLQFGISGGCAVWAGPIHTSKEGKQYGIIIVCPNNYPFSSPRVYPMDDPSKDPPYHDAHVMSDGSLCLRYPSFDSANATVADLAMSAWIWVVHFEHFVETGRWDWDRRSELVEAAELVDAAMGNIKTNVSLINSPDSAVSITFGGDPDVHQALREMRREIERLVHDGAFRSELIEQIEELEIQVKNPARRKGVVKSLVNALRTGLSMSADTAQIWTTWGPALLNRSSPQ